MTTLFYYSCSGAPWCNEAGLHNKGGHTLHRNRVGRASLPMRFRGPDHTFDACSYTNLLLLRKVCCMLVSKEFKFEWKLLCIAYHSTLKNNATGILCRAFFSFNLCTHRCASMSLPWGPLSQKKKGEKKERCQAVNFYKYSSWRKGACTYSFASALLFCAAASRTLHCRDKQNSTDCKRHRSSCLLLKPLCIHVPMTAGDPWGWIYDDCNNKHKQICVHWQWRALL